MKMRIATLGAALALSLVGFVPITAAADINQGDIVEPIACSVLIVSLKSCDGLDLNGLTVTDSLAQNADVSLMFVAASDLGDLGVLTGKDLIGIGDTSAGFSKELPAMFLPEWDIFAVGIDMVAMNPDEVGLGAPTHPGGGLGEDLWVKDQTWFDLFGKKPVTPNDATFLTAGPAPVTG